MTDEEAVRYEVSGGVATITLNRPEARNRLDSASLAELAGSFERADADTAVRVVVLTGTGSTFCAGADMGAVVNDGPVAVAGTGLDGLVRVLKVMLDHSKPIVAKVQGHVAGGGNGLVAASDIAVASADARFAFSEVRIGVAPAVISVVCLQVMDRRLAQELLLTGERVDAERALEARLVTRVVPAVGLDAETALYVEQLLAGAPNAMAKTKGLIRRIPTLMRDEGFAEAGRLSVELFSSDEGREGMSAFLEKRQPAWLATDQQ